LVEQLCFHRSALQQVFKYPNAGMQIPKIRAGYLNNTYVGRLDAAASLMLSRRTFLAGISSSAVLVSACGVNSGAPASDPAADAIEGIVQSKQGLITDATNLLTREPSLSASLQVVIDQNLIHIEALSPYLPANSSAAATAPATQEVNLPALATRCAVFSSNNLSLASKLPDAELSRLLALIAGSEIQHHVLLTELIV
jgi:hypothetical protein